MKLCQRGYRGRNERLAVADKDRSTKYRCKKIFLFVRQKYATTTANCAYPYYIIVHIDAPGAKEHACTGLGHSLLSLLQHGLGDNLFGHLRTVVVGNLPLSILESVNERITSLDDVPGGAHCELVDAVVHAPIGAAGDPALEDLALRLLLEEVDKVGSDLVVIVPRRVADGGQEAGLLGVALGNSIRVEGGKGIVPKREETANFGIANHGTTGKLSLGHDGTVMMSDLPLSIFVLVDEGIPGLDLVAEQIELVDAGILTPVGTDHDVGLEDDALRLLLQKVDEIILDRSVVGPGNIRYCGEKDSLLGVALGDSIGVEGGEGVVPEMEQTADFGLCDGLGNVDALGHDGGVVMGDLPLATLVNVNVGVAGLDNVSGGTHGELNNGCGGNIECSEHAASVMDNM